MTHADCSVASSSAGSKSRRTARQSSRGYAPSLLDILRCPYCGGRLELVSSLFHRTSGETIRDGILGCECCVFPVVDGIPVLHLHAAAVAARQHIEARAPELALRAMAGVADDAQAEQFEAAVTSNDSTFKDI